MGIWQGYRLRLRRRRLLWRSFRSRHALTALANRTASIRPGDILLFASLRNECPRLPWFLDYYRKLGVGHFLLVDNGSTDGSGSALAAEPDVSVWQTGASYRSARFGMDWIGWLMMRYGHGHWSLVVDIDEFLVYPFCDTRPLGALTEWLDMGGIRSFPAMLLDMYPKGPLDARPYRPGQDPFKAACWFDAGNYTAVRNERYGNLWIQGGPRAREFFAAAPEMAPALNKIPLVKWNRRYSYVASTHMLLPRGLNLVYDEWGGERSSGCLLHAKFLSDFPAKAEEEIARREHYQEGVEYRAYADRMAAPTDLWCVWSERYLNWRQLEILGLMSKGGWT